jgi:hypothetical protein
LSIQLYWIGCRTLHGTVVPEFQKLKVKRYDRWI